MSFSIETTIVDLGSTPIENIFLNDFMPMADGTHVKVYLLGLKLTKDNDPSLKITNPLLAKHLGIPLSDVLSAWDFWEEKGIVVKHPNKDVEADPTNYDIEFKSLVQLYVSNNYQIFMPKNPQSKKLKDTLYRSTVNDLLEVSHNPHISSMFSKIDHIVRRPLQAIERTRILDWFYNYNMSPDVILQAFYLAVEKRGKKSVGYVEGIIRNWYDLGITNAEQLEIHMSQNEEKHHRYQLVKKAIGAVNSLPTESEKKIMDRWFEDWKFSLELVLKACEKSSATANPSVNYINGVLSSWHEKGVRTVEDAESESEKFKSRGPKPAPSNVKKTKFHNFEQRSSKYSNEDLERLIREKNDKL